VQVLKVSKSVKGMGSITECKRHNKGHNKKYADNRNGNDC